MHTFPLEFVKVTTEPWIEGPSGLNIYAGGDGGGGSGGSGGSGGFGGSGGGNSGSGASNCQSADNCMDSAACIIASMDSSPCSGVLCQA
jgi:hypothetical protein